MSTKTVFTRVERAELDLLIQVFDQSKRHVERVVNLRALDAFLDRYTEAAIPEHILSCARFYDANYESWDETDCDVHWNNFASIFGDDFQRALDEVRNEKP